MRLRWSNARALGFEHRSRTRAEEPTVGTMRAGTLGSVSFTDQFQKYI
jgi:hypothetical protein